MPYTWRLQTVLPRHPSLQNGKHFNWFYDFFQFHIFSITKPQYTLIKFLQNIFKTNLQHSIVSSQKDKKCWAGTVGSTSSQKVAFMFPGLLCILRYKLNSLWVFESSFDYIQSTCNFYFNVGTANDQVWTRIHLKEAHRI